MPAPQTAPTAGGRADQRRDAISDSLYRLAKRGTDLAVGVMALLAGAPLILLIALLIKLQSGGPILFRQERVGLRGRRFTMYKFRTLPVQPAEVSERRWSPVEPPDAGRFARLLRRLGLDEWPQFWNVIRGEMSVVGPRPERPYFARAFARRYRGYRARDRVKPGITGWAQIHGLRGDTSIGARLRYDLEYVRRRSLAFDWKIAMLTPICAICPRPVLDARRGAGDSQVEGAMSELGEHYAEAI